MANVWNEYDLDMKSMSNDDAKPAKMPEPEPAHWGEMAKALYRGDGPAEEIEREPANRHERRRAAALARRKKVAA